MRIAGVLIMAIGIPFIGWLGYVELYFFGHFEYFELENPYNIWNSDRLIDLLKDFEKRR